MLALDHLSAEEKYAQHQREWLGPSRGPGSTPRLEQVHAQGQELSSLALTDTPTSAAATATAKDVHPEILQAMTLLQRQVSDLQEAVRSLGGSGSSCLGGSFSVPVGPGPPPVWETQLAVPELPQEREAAARPPRVQVQEPEPSQEPGGAEGKAAPMFARSRSEEALLHLYRERRAELEKEALEVSEPLQHGTARVAPASVSPPDSEPLTRPRQGSVSSATTPPASEAPPPAPARSTVRIAEESHGKEAKTPPAGGAKVVRDRGEASQAPAAEPERPKLERRMSRFRSLTPTATADLEAFARKASPPRVNSRVRERPSTGLTGQKGTVGGAHVMATPWRVVRRLLLAPRCKMFTQEEQEDENGHTDAAAPSNLRGRRGGPITPLDPAALKQDANPNPNKSLMEMAAKVNKQLRFRFGGVEAAAVHAALQMGMCTERQVDEFVGGALEKAGFDYLKGCPGATPDDLRACLPPVRFPAQQFEEALLDALQVSIPRKQARQLWRLLAVTTDTVYGDKDHFASTAEMRLLAQPRLLSVNVEHAVASPSRSGSRTSITAGGITPLALMTTLASRRKSIAISAASEKEQTKREIQAAREKEATTPRAPSPVRESAFWHNKKEPTGMNASVLSDKTFYESLRKKDTSEPRSARGSPTRAGGSPRTLLSPQGSSAAMNLTHAVHMLEGTVKKEETSSESESEEEEDEGAKPAEPELAATTIQANGVPQLIPATQWRPMAPGPGGHVVVMREPIIPSYEQLSSRSAASTGSAPQVRTIFPATMGPMLRAPAMGSVVHYVPQVHAPHGTWPIQVAPTPPAPGAPPRAEGLSPSTSMTSMAFVAAKPGTAPYQFVSPQAVPTFGSSALAPTVTVIRRPSVGAVQAPAP